MKRILFTIIALVFINYMHSQEPNDCINPITVCGNGSFSSNATGIGDKQEIFNFCGGVEHNSIWIKINIVQTGQLGFDLIPNDPAVTVDYDFWVFAANKDCSNLGSPIRCATTNPNSVPMTNNITGIDGSTTSTTVGPGADGLGYVKWLDVTAGEFYYICIDRPNGEGGFELKWTGTATLGSGAFPNPPTANSITDYVTCSAASNNGIGIFNLNSVQTKINPDTTNNTITYFESYEDAIDNINVLNGLIYPNKTNPQTVYAKVTDKITGCFSIVDFQLAVSDLPFADMKVSSNAICKGSTVDVTFTGTPDGTVEYTINGGAVQTAILDATGVFLLSDAPIIATTYKLLRIKVLDADGTPRCTKSINISETVTITDLPAATISGEISICEGSKATITFSGTPNAIITYTVDSVTSTITLDATGNASLTTPILSANSTYELVSVAHPGTPACSQPLTGTVVIAVNPMPTASITGDATICSGSSTTITFTGTPLTTVNYNIDGGATQQIDIDASGMATVTTPVLTANSTYSLESIFYTATPASLCKQNLTGSAVVIVNSVLTALITGTTTICSGASTVISFNGTPNVTVNYTVNSVPASINLDASGKATITTPILSANATYELVNVTSAGTPPCIIPLTGSAIITVIPSPEVTISGTTTICSGTTTVITFTGTPNTEVIYTVDTVTATITLDASGNGTVTTPVLTANSIYELVSVTETVAPFCSQAQTGSAVITVNPLPTVTISGTTTICAGTTTTITFTGTPNATVNYTVDGINASVVLDATGNAIVTTPKLIANSTYTLVGAGSSDTPTCIQSQTGSAIITVKPYATITATPASASICSGISTNIVLSSNNTATTFTWTANANNVTGASDGSGALIAQNLSSNGNTSGVVIYAITAITNGCEELPLEVTVNVSPKPTVTANVSKSAICSGETSAIALTSNIVGTTFSWTVVQTNATGATAGSGNAINQVLTATGIMQGTVTYTITPNTNGCLGTPITETITVIPAPIATATATATEICSEEYTNIDIASSLPGTTYTWTVVQEGVSGASDGSGDFIAQKLKLTGFENGSVVYSIFPTVNGCDGKIIEVTIKVNSLPLINLQDGAICVDLNGSPVQTYTLETELDGTNHVFEWFYNGTAIAGANDNNYVASASGVYGVIATNTITGCKSALDTATVSESIPGSAMTLSQSDLFSDNAVITVTVTGGNGKYLYQLDDGEFQEYSRFTNVAPGEHIVNVIDTNGCTNLSEKIFIVGYPKFFTPNGDGYNETWNITALNTIVYKKISIYDRYGKLIIQLNSKNEGWNGSFDGRNLPSSDYWFVFDYNLEGDDRTFRAHFSLKR